MFTFDKKYSQVADKKLNKYSKKLKPYIEKLQDVIGMDGYEQLECSVHLPYDTKAVQEVKDLVQGFDLDKLKYVVLVGIGGSNLGAQAVYEAIQGKYSLLVENQPKMLFLDTVSVENFKAVSDELVSLDSVDEFAVVVISKSGTTVETVVNVETLKANLREKFGSTVKDRMVVVTDKNSAMWQTAIKNEVKKIAVPAKVGGRYSVFSAVGLIPLALVGLDIDKFVDGAREALDDSTDLSIEKNKALMSAIVTFVHNKKGRHILNNFIFNTELESLGMWYRQLIGESLGKDGKGITPLVSIGSVDLHSVAQLFFGGQDDKFTQIIYSSSKSDLAVPSEIKNDKMADVLAGKKFSEVMDAVVGGVKKAYENNDLPFVYMELDEINEKQLGYFLQFKMLEVMYLAQLLQVNAFDQPRVEDYKKETRLLLK